MYQCNRTPRPYWEEQAVGMGHSWLCDQHKGKRVKADRWWWLRG